MFFFWEMTSEENHSLASNPKLHRTRIRIGLARGCVGHLFVCDTPGWFEGRR